MRLMVQILARFVGAQTLHHVVEIHQMAVELRTVHADKFSFDTFLQRASLLLDSAHAAGLRSRVQKLAERLAAARLHELERKTREFLETLPV